MLLKGNKPSKINKISIAQDLLSQHLPKSNVSHRHAFTAKVKIKHPSSNTRTIAIKPFESTNNYPVNTDSQHSAQLVKQQQIESSKNPNAVAQFDNLRLQDFLKMVILRSAKAPQIKPKEIIRSLNGTWFKNTQSSELPSYKLYNNIGIKRSRDQIRPKIGHSFREDGSSNESFHKNYTPPNIFPNRKYSPRKNNHSRLMIGETENSVVKQQDDTPLKANIMLKKSLRQNASLIRKRNSSYFSQRKVSPLSFTKREMMGDEGLLLGKRMIIHNE